LGDIHPKGNCQNGCTVSSGSGGQGVYSVDNTYLGTLEQICPYGCGCQHDGDHCHTEKASHFNNEYTCANKENCGISKNNSPLTNTKFEPYGRKECKHDKCTFKAVPSPSPPPPHPSPPSPSPPPPSPSPPSPSPPSPPPPSPPPPTPPACPFEVQPGECWNQGATLDNCADYFYKIEPGYFRQCLWGPSGCQAGGFSCDAKQQGNSGCNCPAKCPKKLPFVPGAVGSNCKYQGASKNNCDRCP
jgi:hypothetical protein